MGSEESHFNVSLIVRDKVTRQCPETTILKRRESRSGFEPRSLCLPAYRLTARPNRFKQQQQAAGVFLLQCLTNHHAVILSREVGRGGGREEGRRRHLSFSPLTSPPSLESPSRGGRQLLHSLTMFTPPSDWLNPLPLSRWLLSLFSRPSSSRE